MNTAAKLFIEQAEGNYTEIGDVIASGVVDFYSGMSSFAHSAVDIKPLKKRIPSKKMRMMRKYAALPNFGSIAVLVSTNKKSFLDKEILSVDRKNFRVAYPDGETHTLSCIAMLPGGHDPYLHIQLMVCAKPLIENRSAATYRELQAHLSDLNSP